MQANSSGSSSTTATLQKSLLKSKEEKTSYEKKLETAQGVDIYKYILLINNSALEVYIAQARLQAQQSFDLSRAIAIAGFIIVAVAICLSIYLTAFLKTNLNAAYLTGIAGVLTEFIAVIFFLLYSKTLDQVNRFHDKLVDMQKTSLDHIANSKITATAAFSPDNSPGDRLHVES
jgi:hypothetical protein